jgi:hypothetical protein
MVSMMHVCFAGLAVAKPPVYVPSREGTPHMFQLHAVVHSVSPNTGERTTANLKFEGIHFSHTGNAAALHVPAACSGARSHPKHM